jgi:galactitol PTS system EIIC component
MSDLFFSIGKYITGFPNYALMPIIIMLVGLALGADLKKAFRSGILVGIGFIGIGMATAVFFGEVTPVAQNIVTNLGFGKEIVDVGWPVAAAIGFASQVGSAVFVIGILVNLIMLVTKLTKTVDVDIWNYWHWAFAGGIVASVTGSFWWGCLAAAVYAVITLLLGDYTAPMFQEYYGWPDISMSHGGGMAIWLVQYPIIKLFDLLGWKNTEKESDLEKMRKNVGVFGDPTMVGLMVGLGLGILSQIGGGNDFYTALVATVKVGMNAAAVMFIIPKMVAILMEGLIPISDQARIFLEKRFKGTDRKFYIGMDTALLLGDEMVLTLGIVMIPITIAVGLLMPWNKIMPFGILPALPYYMVILPPLTKGNFWKAIAVATVYVAIAFTFGTFMAPDVTAAAVASGYTLPEGMSTVGIDGNVVNFVMWSIAKLFGG